MNNSLKQVQQQTTTKQQKALKYDTSPSARTKNKNDNLFKTPKSLNESDPYMIKIIPKIVSPNTKQNVSNILIASGDGDSPKASTTRAFNISWLNRLNISGIAWINIRAIFILNIVLIFIV